MHDLGPYLTTLANQAHAEGGWGYVPGQPAHPEPTCLALLALSLQADRFPAALDSGYNALRQCSAADGTYRFPQGRQEAVWPTALVLFVQAALQKPVEDQQRTANRLLDLQGWVVEADPEMAQTNDIDPRIPGWPWAESNFSWTEPTAWACLALRRAGHGDHPRVIEGQRLLLNRAFEDGGINYGNRRIFGKSTEPIPGPTALMLLALQGQGEHPLIASAIDYLQRQAADGEDLEHLAWARLALDAYANRPEVEACLPNLDQRIQHTYQSRQAINWVRPAPMREALTALALGTGQGNPFRLAPQQPLTEVLAHRPTGSTQTLRRKRSLIERVRSTFLGALVETRTLLGPPPTAPTVHIAKAGDYNGDLADVLKRQYEAFRAKVPLAGKRVVLKPNLVEYRRDRVINTHPQVIAAVIELCRHEGAKEVIVAEGPGHWRNVEYLVSASGLGDVLRHYQAPFVDLNHDEPVKLPNLGWQTQLDCLFLAQTIVTAEVLISLPKLKTHHWAGATLSLKNLFGTLPGICYGWPKNELHWRGIDNSIVDIALTRPPDLAIVDGIIGMEGDGPLNGTARPMGVLIMGTDLVAVDATCCRLMQLDPEKIGYLTLGVRKKLGVLAEAQIQQLGEGVAALSQPFATLPQFQKLYLGRSA